MENVQNILPSKGDKVLNTLTGRYIVVGNAAWRKLVLSGHISGAYKGVNSVKKAVKAVKVVEQEMEQEQEQEMEHETEMVESSDDENLEELEARLAEVLKKQEMVRSLNSKSQPAKKKAGRPKTVVFQSKTIELEDDDSGSEIEFD
jgi:hypothetical protein